MPTITKNIDIGSTQMFFIRLLYIPVDSLLHFHTNRVASHVDVAFSSQAHPQAEMLSPRAGSHSGLKAAPHTSRPLLQRQKSPFQPEGPAIPV